MSFNGANFNSTARIAVIGAAEQEIYLIDHDDLKPTQVGDVEILGKVIVENEIEIDRLQYETGGDGLNAAVTLARGGHEVILLSNIDNDAAGEAILMTLDAEGIDSSYLGSIAGKPTGTAVRLLDSVRGKSTTLNCRGASGKFSNFSARDLDGIQPDWLCVTGVNGEMETLLEFFEKARGMGAKILWAPGAAELSQPKKALGLLSDVDTLVVNKAEAAELVPGAVLEELLYHLGAYVPRLIITDGAMGGIAGDQEISESYRFGIYEDVRAKDKTGVGAAFAAGFLSSYAKGTSFVDAITFASANATAVVREVGAHGTALTGTEELHMMPIQKI